MVALILAPTLFMNANQLEGWKPSSYCHINSVTSSLFAVNYLSWTSISSNLLFLGVFVNSHDTLSYCG